MSSSPSISKDRQASAKTAQLQDGRQYRQVVYHSPNVDYVIESRRRSRMVREVESQQGAYVDWILYPSDDTSGSSPAHSIGASRRCPSSELSSRSPNRSQHVTVAKHSSRIKPKAVILAKTLEAIETNMSSAKGSLLSSAGPTPPPTPRLTRLPSPDLSDLDVVPFCKCGLDVHVIKLCTSCQKSCNPRML